MQIMGLPEVLERLEIHRSTRIREFIETDDDGNETINLNKPDKRKMQAVKRAEFEMRNGKVVKVNSIDLTNGEKARVDCFVYLIQAENGLTKIGFTDNVAVRFSQLNTSSPVELKVIGVIKTAIAEVLEAELHERYKDVRVRGEWFRLTDNHIREILSGDVWQDQPS